jgi:hypothetical protein
VLDAAIQRHGDARCPVEDPLAPGALVEQKLELESRVGRRGAGRQRASELGYVDVCGRVEVSTVPRLFGVAGHVGVVRDQRPAGEMVENGALVVEEDGDVDIPVMPGLPAEPRVGRPSATEKPRRTETTEQVPHVPDGLRRRLPR